MAKLIICRGIPGSGKSYWANLQFLANPENVVVVNRDEIREEYNCVGAGWSKEKEIDFIIPEMDKRIRDGLNADKTVISSDTNIRRGNVVRLMHIASRLGATVEIKKFDTDLELCIERDSRRNPPWKVGREQIIKYYWELREEN